MNMKYALTGLLAAGMLAGCESVGDKTLIGAGAGAIAGAGLGTLAGGDDRRNAAIGAAVGAIAGGAVGVYMDRQEEALRRQTAGTGIEVERKGDQIELTMPSGITFDVNSSTIQPSFYSPLNDVAATLVEFPSTAVDIIGHASADGPDDYNMTLSQQRAGAVQTYLVGQGVNSVRVSAYGLGETQPTGQGYAADRRVEILLTPVVDESA